MKDFFKEFIWIILTATVTAVCINMCILFLFEPLQKHALVLLCSFFVINFLVSTTVIYLINRMFKKTNEQILPITLKIFEDLCKDLSIEYSFSKEQTLVEKCNLLIEKLNDFFSDKLNLSAYKKHHIRCKNTIKALDSIQKSSLLRIRTRQDFLNELRKLEKETAT